MSLKELELISKSDDFFSVQSNLSDNSQSFESIYQSSEVNGNNYMDVCQRIGHLQDKRYDATYNISELKLKVIEIEKHELELMKESTIQHSHLQDSYITCKDDNDHVKKLANEAAQRLGCMKYELKMLSEQVQLEQEKLEELEEQIQKIKIRIEESAGQELEDFRRQMSVLEEQRDQQSKIFEDLEFKELETQSRFEEESELLKRNIIEAQRKFIVSSRDRENRKLVLDEQQISLMKETRRALDKLESERNCCNQQMAYYQYVINACNNKIEDLNRKLDNSEYVSFTEQSLTLMDHNDPEVIKDNDYAYLSEFTSKSRSDNQDAVSLIVESAYNSSAVSSSVHTESLHDKLESLTEIVRLNLNIPPSKYNGDGQLSNSYTTTTNVNVFDQYRRRNTDSYLSNLSLSDDSGSLVKTDSAICLGSCSKPMVTFESLSIGDSTSSGQSNTLGDRRKYSTGEMSELSNNDENCQPGTRPMVVARKKDRASKQSRPLTCFLPKMHSDFNLRNHIESCGHDLTVCSNHITIDKNTCQGFLWKLSNRLFSVYRKRWFCFDQTHRELRYYTSKSKTKLKGVISFQSILDVFVDHTHRVKSPQKLSFCIETQAKTLHLVTARMELVTLWVDVIFTGAEAYLSLHPPFIGVSTVGATATCTSETTD